MKNGDSEQIHSMLQAGEIQVGFVGSESIVVSKSHDALFFKEYKAAHKGGVPSSVSG